MNQTKVDDKVVCFIDQTKDKENIKGILAKKRSPMK